MTGAGWDGSASAERSDICCELLMPQVQDCYDANRSLFTGCTLFTQKWVCKEPELTSVFFIFAFISVTNRTLLTCYTINHPMCKRWMLPRWPQREAQLNLIWVNTISRDWYNSQLFITTLHPSPPASALYKTPIKTHPPLSCPSGILCSQRSHSSSAGRLIC